MSLVDIGLYSKVIFKDSLRIKIMEMNLFFNRTFYCFNRDTKLTNLAL